MVKLIDSVNNFNPGVVSTEQYLNLSLLSNKFHCLLKLSKQCNFKNIFIGSKWKGSGIYEGTGLHIDIEYWKPLGFERSIVYK